MGFFKTLTDEEQVEKEWLGTVTKGNLSHKLEEGLRRGYERAVITLFKRRNIKKSDISSLLVQAIDAGCLSLTNVILKKHGFNFSEDGWSNGYTARNCFEAAARQQDRSFWNMLLETNPTLKSDKIDFSRLFSIVVREGRTDLGEAVLNDVLLENDSRQIDGALLSVMQAGNLDFFKLVTLDKYVRDQKGEIILNPANFSSHMVQAMSRPTPERAIRLLELGAQHNFGRTNTIIPEAARQKTTDMLRFVIKSGYDAKAAADQLRELNEDNNLSKDAFTILHPLVDLEQPSKRTLAAAEELKALPPIWMETSDLPGQIKLTTIFNFSTGQETVIAEWDKDKKEMTIRDFADINTDVIQEAVRKLQESRPGVVLPNTFLPNKTRLQRSGQV